MLVLYFRQLYDKMLEGRKPPEDSGYFAYSQNKFYAFSQWAGYFIRQNR